MADPFIEAPKLGDGSPTAQYSNPITISYAKRQVTMHTVTEGELDTVASLSNSVDLGFFMGSGGVFATIAVTLATVTLAPAALAAFVGAALASGGGTLFFGIRARISYRAAQEKLREIKRGNLANPH